MHDKDMCKAGLHDLIPAPWRVSRAYGKAHPARYCTHCHVMRSPHLPMPRLYATKEEAMQAISRVTVDTAIWHAGLTMLAA